jgi:adenylate kinase family enzyme
MYTNQTVISLQFDKKKIIIFSLLLGYPRTINQAVAFKETFPNLDFSAVHIMLERWVAIEKTLGRQVVIYDNYYHTKY